MALLAHQTSTRVCTWAVHQYLLNLEALLILRSENGSYDGRQYVVDCPGHREKHCVLTIVSSCWSHHRFHLRYANATTTFHVRVLTVDQELLASLDMVQARMVS